MKRFLVILCVLFPCMAYAAGGERIVNFDSFMTVKPAGDMDVVETISVVCAGDRIKHGIYRDFPTRYQDKYQNTVRVTFEVQSVLRDGEPESWWTEDLDNGVRVYIGSKDTTLTTGLHTFAITYRTNRQLGFFDGHDELYWNVTGNAWEFGIEKASATVELPRGAGVISTEAYTGYAGDKGTDYTSQLDDKGRAVFSTTRPLDAREGFTIVVTWPKGFVHEPTREERARYFLADNRSTIAGLAGIMVLLCTYYLIWLKVGRDPEKGVIIPLYEAPQGFSPAAVRYVMRMGFDHKAFAASIVNMAVKGWLTIHKDAAGEYTLTRNDPVGSPISRGEARIAQHLFSSWTSLTIKTENHAAIAQAIKALKKSLAVEYEKLYFLTNKGALVPGLIISVLTLAAIVIMGRNTPLALGMTLWLSGWTAACSMLVFKAFKEWRAARMEQSMKIFNYGSALIVSVFTLPFLVAEGFGLWAFSQATSIPAVACILLIVVLNILFYHLMKAPTIKGRKVMDAIEGLKLYLSVAEKDRLNALNPPEKTPEVFEALVPYAFALDVEQEWCEQFADVLERAQAENKYQPGWYTGDQFTAGGAAGLASGLGSMSSSISASSSPPGSSSGSGGGGSSGGGGGGGGGGGW